MNAKLTLTIKKDTITNAKTFAKESNKSLSAIVEEYLKSLVEKEIILDKSNVSPLVQALKGSFKMPDSFDYDMELNNRREEKYSN